MGYRLPVVRCRVCGVSQAVAATVTRLCWLRAFVTSYTE